MKYFLKNSKKKNIITYKEPKNVLVIKPRFRNNNFEVNKITIVDSELSRYYAKGLFNKKINKILKLVEIILDSENSDEGDTNKVFGELEKLKSILENEYKKFITIEEYKEFLTTIILAQKQLRDNYMQKLMIEHYKNNIMMANNENIKQGRAR
jgi:hypothetical protein